MAKLISDATVRYRDTLLADVLVHGEVEGHEAFLVEAFTDLILDDLEQEGVWPDYQVATHRERGAEVSAYGYDRDRRIVFLSVTSFERSRESLRLTTKDAEAQLKRLAGFVTRARAGKIEVPEHNPVDDLLALLGDCDAYDELRLVLIADQVAPELSLGQTEVDGVPAMQEIWDLETIRRTRSTGERLDPIDVEFGDGLPYLGSLDAHEDVQSLLFFLPAPLLAEAYNQHGGRLLERNVRAFLSARGKVNRGIRDTIRDEPERFLAYNNGLTATAAKVEVAVVDGIPVLQRVHDLQIVNGGQTTASIAAAVRDGIDVSAVQVQVKLVVIDGEILEQMVPNISRFANRQNAVQESDLTSNNDYLRRLQEASRTEWTPHAASGRPTKWYFERARGSFGVDLASSGGKASQKEFLTEYPKGQKFTKNDMAVFENTWSRLPHLVSRGGQKNYVEFMERLPDAPEGTEAEIDEWHRQRFRQLAAKAVLFKEADRLVRVNHGGAYKRQVVTYTLAWVLERVEPVPSLAAMWETQAVHPDFSATIVEVSGQLKDRLIETALGQNVAEWAKRERCWEQLRKGDFTFTSPSRPQEHEPARMPRSTGKGRGFVDLVGKDPIRSRSGMMQSLRGDHTLAQAVLDALGVEVEATSRRQKRRCWLYHGDTDIPAPSGRGTLGAFGGLQPTRSGPGYLYNVVVDVGTASVIELDALDERRLAGVLHWLHLHNIPNDDS